LVRGNVKKKKKDINNLQNSLFTYDDFIQKKKKILNQRKNVPKKFFLSNLKTKSSLSLSSCPKKGTILIFLHPLRYHGKKGILLNITSSGNLVITGPCQINGIPLQKIHPNYLIATGKQLNLMNLNFRIFTDSYFKTICKIKKKKKMLMSQYETDSVLDAHKIRQIFIDDSIKKEIRKDFFLPYYLKTTSHIFPQTYI
jgi:large subunit ribosomal protein L6e